MVSAGLGLWKWLVVGRGPVLSSHLDLLTVDPLLGCSQAVPLVPLTEENEEAMEKEPFQQLLRKLGVRPPASEQVHAPVTVSAELCWCCFRIYLLVLLTETAPAVLLVFLQFLLPLSP